MDIFYLGLFLFLQQALYTTVLFAKIDDSEIKIKRFIKKKLKNKKENYELYNTSSTFNSSFSNG